MKVLISGSSGFIGTALADSLKSSGHRVIRLVRRPVLPGQDAVSWHPEKSKIDAWALEGIDAVVHLAGEGIGDHRWTESHKARVVDSRVKGTTLLAEAIADLDAPPKVMISSSAIGYYGFDSGDRAFTENDPPGSGFLAGVVEQWETATEPAEKAGIRVVRTRSGVILSPNGGALKRQVLPFKFFVGGKLATGKQYFSWISLTDEVGAVEFLLERNDISGPVNLTAPNPVTNAEFTRALGVALGRPTFFTVPSIALKLVFSTEMAEEMLLGGQRVLPERLQRAGYQFTDTDPEAALRRMLG